MRIEEEQRLGDLGGGGGGTAWREMIDILAGNWV